VIDGRKLKKMNPPNFLFSKEDSQKIFFFLVPLCKKGLITNYQFLKAQFMLPLKIEILLGEIDVN